MGIVLKLLQGDIVWATFFGDFRSKYCCHMPVSGIIPYTFSYQITAFFTEFFLLLVRMRAYITRFAAGGSRGPAAK